jgi:pimeloyl-ACP methyl ester carboxylesterase
VQVAALTGHATMAALAAEVLRYAPPRFALAGLSMGGIVAMEMSAQAPERIERLALLDTNPLAERPEVQARRGPQMAAVQAGRLAGVMRDEMKPNYLAEGPGKAAILDLCMEMALALGPEVFVRQSLALRDRADRQEALRALDVPALVLCGAEDRLCPPERHHLLHGLLRRSRLVIVPGAAHLPTLERAEVTTRALADWLDA